MASLSYLKCTPQNSRLVTPQRPASALLPDLTSQMIDSWGNCQATRKLYSSLNTALHSASSTFSQCFSVWNAISPAFFIHHILQVVSSVWLLKILSLSPPPVAFQTPHPPSNPRDKFQSFLFSSESSCPLASISIIFYWNCWLIGLMPMKV